MITYDLKKFFYIIIALLQFDFAFLFIVLAYIFNFFTNLSLICAVFALFSFILGGWSINRLRKGDEV